MKQIKIVIAAAALITVFIAGWEFVNGVEIVQPKIYSFTKRPPEEQKTIKLIAVGDIMLSRDVEQKMIQKNDWAYPFRETYQVTTTGDLVFGNLETPIIEGPAVPTGSMTFRADPKTIEGLKFGGFDALSLANNHIKNYGEEGIKKTIEYLDKADIAHTGAGLNITEARQPAIIEINNKKIGFLGYVDSSFTSNTYEATDSRAGSPFLNEQLLIEDLDALQKKVDSIIVSMHAGAEYSNIPNQKQIDFAHSAIDNGATLVIGHHPHVVQPIEQYHGGYIFYSLGNFIFDQMWSMPTRDSVIAEITFSNDTIESVNLVPIKIYDYCQPRVLSDTAGKVIIDQMTSKLKTL